MILICIGTKYHIQYTDVLYGVTGLNEWLTLDHGMIIKIKTFLGQILGHRLRAIYSSLVSN